MVIRRMLALAFVFGTWLLAPGWLHAGTVIPLRNSGFELVQGAEKNNFVDWDSWNRNDCNQDTKHQHGGEACLRTWWSFAMWQDFAVTPGNEYEISIWAYIPSDDPLTGTKYGYIKIDWLESDQNSVIYGILSQPVKKGLPVNQWQHITVKGVAAPTARWGRFVIEFKEGEGDGVILWDDAQAMLVRENSMLPKAGDTAPPFSMSLLDWVIKTGDEPAWKNPGVNDSMWQKIKVPSYWEESGLPNYDGYAWYRCTFSLPPMQPENLILLLGRVDDVDATYVNGSLVGSVGKFPPDFSSAWHDCREYPIDKKKLVFGGKNVVAVRVYDGGGGGGIWEAAGGRSPVLPRVVNGSWLKLYFERAQNP